jgi:hypothetical protein
MEVEMKIVKVVTTIFGLLLILAGGVFFLQGINVITARSFMRGDMHWSVYGGIMFMVGAVLIAAANWSYIRRKK